MLQLFVCAVAVTALSLAAAVTARKSAERALMDNITGRKRAEGDLGESEERFRATFAQAAVGIAHVAPDGRWLRVNDKLCAIVGYSQEELRERTFQDITHPDDLEADLNFVRRVLACEITTYSMEKRYFHKRQLNEALDLVKQLHGLLPICSYCKKIRDDRNYWHQVEAYITRHTEARFSHSICPDCLANVVHKPGS
ncbi:MAG: PAS domain S-box protein [Planctomycetes bacterium]|nr:PAS domain S-box protein [Planctomycetota bacterium]